MTDPNRPVTGYPPATAYTYAAQPPPTQPAYFNVSSTNYYPNAVANQQRATFLRRMFAVIITFIIILGTITFITWLVLRPQLPQFRVETLTLTNFNLTSNSMISGNWDAGVTVRNPNSKMTLYYDRVQAAVFYKSESIAETSIAPFVQGKKNETVVRATFVSVSAYVDDRVGIDRERGSGMVGFNLRMVARVRFKAGGWWARRRILRVYCPDLSVRVLNNGSAGSLTGGSKHCRVGL